VATNIDCMQAVLAHPDFTAGAVGTDWVESKFGWQHEPPSIAALAAAALAGVLGSASGAGPGPRDSDPYSPWKARTGFRMGAG
jgi:hypothetical protein